LDRRSKKLTQINIKNTKDQIPIWAKLNKNDDYQQL
jgi:hypothetical protein